MYSQEIESTDLKKARESLVEELEAINWYETRLEKVQDAALKKVLEHNRDEEKEHAAMLIEWIRKTDPKQNDAFKKHD
ncbi:MAG: ferritin [Candidatus Micrarchaeales archaeon]|jgi:hypothetical protein